MKNFKGINKRVLAVVLAFTMVLTTVSIDGTYAFASSENDASGNATQSMTQNVSAEDLLAMIEAGEIDEEDLTEEELASLNEIIGIGLMHMRPQDPPKPPQPTVQTKEITLHLNGGTLNGQTSASVTVIKKTFYKPDGKVDRVETPDVSLASYIPVKAGQVFDGWFNGNSENSHKITSVNYNTVGYGNNIFAIYRDCNKKNITLYKDGAVYDTIEVVENASAITLENVTVPTGYTFLGWYDSEEGGNRYTAVTYTSPEALYAHIAKIQYTIDYHNNIEVPEKDKPKPNPVKDAKIAIKVGESLAAYPYTDQIPAGYYFAGWTLTHEECKFGHSINTNSILIPDGAVLTSEMLDKMISCKEYKADKHEITLHAKFEKNQSLQLTVTDNTLVTDGKLRFNYDGENHSFAFAVTNQDNQTVTDATVRIYSDAACTKEVSNSFKNVVQNGTYYAVASKTGYLASEAVPVTVDIKEKEYTISWNYSEPLVYNGSWQKVYVTLTGILPADQSKITVKCDNNSGRNYVTHLDAKKYVGKFEGIGNSDTAKNYKLAANQPTTLNWEIVKADKTVSISMSDWEYGKKASEPVLTYPTSAKDNHQHESVVVTYYTDKDCSKKTTANDGASKDGAKPANPGSYYVELAFTSDNYVNYTVSDDFAISAQDVQFFLVTEGQLVPYGDGSLEDTVGFYDEYKLEISNKDKGINASAENTVNAAYSYASINDEELAALLEEGTLKVARIAYHNTDNSVHMDLVAVNKVAASLSSWTYDGTAHQPTISQSAAAFDNAEDQIAVSQNYEVAYFDREGNSLNAAPTEVGNYTLKVTFLERVEGKYGKYVAYPEQVVTVDYSINAVPFYYNFIPRTPATPVTPEEPVVEIPEEETPAAPAAPVVEAPAEEPEVEAEVIEEEPSAAAEAVPAEEPVETIEEEAVAADAEISTSWSLANMIAMLLAAIEAIALVIAFARKRNQKAEGEPTFTNSEILKLVSIPVALAAVIVFFVTQDLAGLRVATDSWTPCMVILAAAQTILAFVAKKTETPATEKVEK